MRPAASANSAMIIASTATRSRISPTAPTASVVRVPLHDHGFHRWVNSLASCDGEGDARSGLGSFADPHREHLVARRRPGSTGRRDR